MAWDSEGHQNAGIPTMVLLANSDKHSCWNPDGISTLEALEFILKNADSNAIHISYSFSYDVNLMLRDLPKRLITRLWRTTRVYWKDYRIVYIPRKLFRVSGPHGSITIWDVFGFFQTSFINACRDWLGVEDDVLTQGKTARGSMFMTMSREQIEEYNAQELYLLVQLMETVRRHLTDAGITMTRWDGSGAIAAQVLKRHGVQEKPPDPVREHAYLGFYGGRIETFGFGTHFGPCWGYDIRSAYPWAMSQIPEIDHASWEIVKGFEGRFGIYEVVWNIKKDLPFYPFPMRDSRGRLLYPKRGRGWVWYPELMAALKLDLCDIEVVQGVVTNTGEGRPYAWVADLYQQRMEWKREGVAAEKVLKLGINSLYGKLAQTLGYDPQKLRLPPFHNPVEAGLITAWVRAKLFLAMCEKPDAIAWCSTDGIMSRERLDLTIGNDLGNWSKEKFDGFCVIMSGVYGKLRDDKWEWNHRGFPKDSVNYDVLFTAWSEKEDRLTVYKNTFRGMGITVETGNWGDWGRFVLETRELLINGHGEYKRLLPVIKRRYRPWERFYPNRAWDGSVNNVSYAYQPFWGTAADKLEQLKTLQYNHLEMVEEMESII